MKSVLIGAAIVLSMGGAIARADGMVRGRLLGLTPDSVVLGQSGRKVEVPNGQITSGIPSSMQLGSDITLQYRGPLKRSGRRARLLRNLDDRAFYPA